MKDRLGDISFQKMTFDKFFELKNFISRYPSSTSPISGLSCSSLLAWNESFSYSFSILSDETLLIGCCKCCSDSYCLLCPFGNFPKSDQDKLLYNFGKFNKRVRIIAASEQFITRRENIDFLKNFECSEDRGQFNYVYLAQDLAELRGRKYQKKRNLIHQAEEAYEWEVEAIVPQSIEPLREFLLAYEKEQEGISISNGLLEERKVLNFYLDHLNDFIKAGLDISGICIKIDGVVVAFAIYEVVTLSDHEPIAHVYFEKALRARKGMYQVVNYETSKIIFSRGIRKINREEDLGDEGLRKAKLSYYPIEMVKSWSLNFKGWSS